MGHVDLMQWYQYNQDEGAPAPDHTRLRGESGWLWVTVSGSAQWLVPVKVTDTRESYGTVQAKVYPTNNLDGHNGPPTWVAASRLRF
jgi:hypothetical protein